MNLLVPLQICASIPMLIGNSYKSKPNAFNFDYKSNQNEYDLNSSDFLETLHHIN